MISLALHHGVFPTAISLWRPKEPLHIPILELIDLRMAEHRPRGAAWDGMLEVFLVLIIGIVMVSSPLQCLLMGRHLLVSDK